MNDRIINILINNHVINREEADIYKYGLFVLNFNLLIIFSFLLQGFLSSQLKFTVLFLAFYLPLRIYLGGYHCETPQRCFIVSNIFYFFILILHPYFHHLYYISLCGLFIVLILYYRRHIKNHILFVIVFIETMLSVIMQLRIYIITAFLSNEFLYVLYIIKEKFIVKN